MKKPTVTILAIIFLSASISIQARELVYSTSQILFVYACTAILMEAHERIGIKLTIQRFPAKRALPMANDGFKDGSVLKTIALRGFYARF